MSNFVNILKSSRKNIVLLIIVWIAFAVRIFYISELPPSLNWDEVSHGYNGYSILKTGVDEWGVKLPTIFKAYGDYKLPSYIYLTSLSEALFGVNALSVRLPSVLAGTLSVLFSYLIARKLFNKKVGLITAFLVAFEPWSLFLSRGAFEANLAFAFVVAGAYFFLLGVRREKFLLLSAFLLGLSVWTYNSARIFVPLLIAVLVVLYWEKLLKFWKKGKVSLLFPLAIVSFFFVPMVIQIVNPQGQARYSKVAIIDEGALAKINQARASSDLPLNLSRFVYNKGTYFANSFVKNYFSHFSLNFLFFEGGSHYQFNIPDHGLLYLVNLPFLLLGFLYLLKRRDRGSVLVLSWIFLAPIASSVTREAPHVLRSIVFLPMPMLLSAIGLSVSYKWLKSRIGSKSYFLAGMYFFFLLLQIENYGFLAATEYRTKYSWSWQYGHEEMVNYVKDNYDDYDAIIVTKEYGEPHEFFLFYWPWDPASFINDPNLTRFYQSEWYWVDGFGKLFFVNHWEIPREKNENFFLESGKEISCQRKKCLLVTTPGNFQDGWKMVKQINFLNNETAFEIYEN